MTTLSFTVVAVFRYQAPEAASVCQIRWQLEARAKTRVLTEAIHSIPIYRAYSIAKLTAYSYCCMKKRLHRIPPNADPEKSLRVVDTQSGCGKRGSVLLPLRNLRLALIISLAVAVPPH